MQNSTRAVLALTFLALSGCPRKVAELGSITITPETGRVARGEQVQYVATAIYSDGSIQDITADARWSVDDAYIAETSDAPGLVKGLHQGETVVRFRYQERMLTRPLVVGGARLRELQLDPPHPTMPAGLGVALTVTAIDSDGAKYDVTAEAVWSSSASQVAQVEDAMVKGRSVGSAMITASVQGLLVSVPVDVTDALVTSLDVQPAALTLQNGVTHQLTATALLSDGSSLDVTRQCVWRSSAPTIVFASELPREEGLIVGRRPGTARITASVLGQSGATDVTVTAATLTSLELSPPLTTLAVATSQRFVATGVFSDGSTADLSAQVTWASSNEPVVTVTAGLARALSPGRASISAAFGTIRATRDLNVSPATLASLELSPMSPMVARGLTLELQAFGVFSDGTRQELTGVAVWRVADATRATVSNALGTSGRVTGLLEGTTEVTAAIGTITARTSLTVSAASLLMVQLSPTAPTLPLGTRAVFTATGLFSDGTTQDLTAQATWTSSVPACVSISSQGASRGEALALVKGNAIISATIGGHVGTATVTVTDAVLSTLELTPSPAMLPLGVTQNFTATGVFTDGTVADLSAQATWASSAPAIATVSNAPGAQGEVRALTVGVTQLTARLGSTVGTAQLTVTPATLTRLELTPATATIAVGLTRDFTVTGTYSDASTADLTAQASFSVLNTTFAQASNAPGTRGQIIGRAAGTTKLVATAMGFTAQADLTITPATLVSLTLSPPSLALAHGTTGRLRADATFSDGSTADVTSQVTWSSTQTTFVSVSNAAGTEGRLTALAVGSATVRAQLGAMSVLAVITVTPATLDAIEVSPTNPQLPLGASLRLTATGRYSDGSAQDLSAQASWVSATPAVVSVSNGTGVEGRVSALAQGSAIITATFGGKNGRTTVSVTPATLARIDVTPPTPRLAQNTRIALTATGVWSDGATQNLTDTCVWSSADAALATVSNAVGTHGRVSGVSDGTVTISASCAGVTGTVDVVISTATLVSISLTPAAPTAAAGFSARLTATGVFSDGTTQPLSDLVSWSSADTARATVSNAAGSEGLVLARAQGAVVISATLMGVTGTANFVVSAAVLQSVEVTPSSASVPRGLSQAFVATGHFSDGSTATITESATWSSSASNVATVSNAAGTRGHTNALVEGTTTLSATVSGFTGLATLTVSPAALTSLNVTPPMPSIARGLSLQLTATGTFSDGTTRDLTTSVTWSLGDGSVATVSNADGSRGLLQTVNVGTSTLIATLGAISGNTTLTVTPATLVSVGVTPASPSVPRGLGLQLTAIGVYTDGNTADLTSQAVWATSDGTHVTVSNAPGSEGRIQAVGFGPASLSATFNGLTGATTVTVSAAVLQSLSLSPSNPSVAAGLTVPLSATGVYSDATTQNLTASVSWSSGDASIANVSGGLVGGVRVGSTSLFATLGGVTGSTSITVTAALLLQLQVSPQNVSRPKGVAQQFTAMGVFTDNSTADLTTSVSWASTSGAVASISNANGTRGRATTPGVGSVTISATLGSVSGSTPFTVTPAQLTSVFLLPGNGTAPLGSARQYTAYGLFTDASTQNVTTQAAWSSTVPAVATISNAPGSYGLATTLSTGSTTISASYGGFFGSSSLSVIQTTLTRIDLTPANGGNTALGYTRQFIAIGTYDDGTTQNLTDAVTWSSSDESIAIVANASGSRGLMSTVGVGTFTVSASLGGVTGSSSHTVTPAVLVALALTPSSPLSLATAGTAQLTAIGFFSDGSTQDLTGAVSWVSTATGVVQVSNAGGSEGLATGITAGNASISASLGGVSSSLNVVVN